MNPPANQNPLTPFPRGNSYRTCTLAVIVYFWLLLFFPTTTHAQYCTSSGHDNTSEWISQAKLNTLNNSSGKNSNAYGNYTAKSTTLFIGYNYTIYVKIGGTYNEYLTAWIDYNNNQTFEPEEMILRASGKDSVNGNFKIPFNTLPDTVRMRVLMHYGSFTDDPCAMNLNYGETEDYTIMLADKGTPPETDFSVSNTFDCDGMVVFVNNTNGVVTSTLWDFGDGNTSTVPSPLYTYLTSGIFTVSLISANIHGSDTLIKTGYITTVVDSIVYCDTVFIPESQAGPLQTSCRGVLYDAGGEFDYPSGMDGSITISPTGADAVKLTFEEFDFENTYDFLYVYDGPNSSSPLIGKYTGNTLPEGGIITSSGNSITLRQTSDGGVENAGFKLKWDCIILTDKPVADFKTNTIFSCGNVAFNDLSTNIPSLWVWDFGDGNTSTEKNPLHTYLTTGKYSVRLISTNSQGSDTAFKSDYIFIKTDSSACDTIIIPATGAGITQTNCTGNVTDNGVTNNYANNSNGILTIAPTSATIVKLTFSEFDTEDNYDYLYIYDGADTTKPLIGKYSGTTLPGNGIIYSTGSSLTLKFTSDGGFAKPGFIAYWECIIVDSPPSADFTSDRITSCGPVYFTDLSTDLPDTWLWDFGDGSMDSIKNPGHRYTIPGIYTVNLIAGNSFGSDTMIKTGFIIIDFDSTTICDTVFIPVSGTGILQTQCLGILYDNGGENNYSNNSNGKITISPSSANIVKLTFSQFNLEDNADYLYIFDGADTSKPLIGKFTGTSLPGNGIIVSSGPSITLKFTSNTSTVLTGFIANWECIVIDSPPVANFTSDIDTSCGPVYFTDLSTDWPDTLHWDFGDDSTSSDRNPMHRYITPGTYSVTLIAKNSFGSDTVIKTGFITIQIDSTTVCDTAIVPKQGMGTTQTACTGFVIDNGIKNDYSDQSNGIITITPSGADYLTLTFSSFHTELNYDFLYLYDGSDIDATLIGKFSGDSLPNGDGKVTSSGNSLTLRFTSDNGTTRPGFEAIWKCANATNPPVADFSADDSTDLCGVATFQDRSTDYPTSWLWDFGDGTTDSVRNPTHYYQIGGKFTIKLICSNRNSSDTATKPDFITVKPDSLIPSLSSCDPVITASLAEYGIQKILIDTLAIVSINLPNEKEYQDYSCEKYFTVTEGIKYLFTVFTSMTDQENVRIWIDYNDNGNFEDPGELILAVDNLTEEHSDSVKISGRAVLNQMLRMRVISDASSYGTPFPCGPVINGQIEDYGIFIKPNPLPPVTDFKANKTTACISTLQFTDLTKNAVRTWLWDFGDGTTDTTQNPSHAYQTPGFYTVKLTTTNSVETVTETKNNYINILSGGPKPISCAPPTLAYCCQAGIQSVRFNNIDVSTYDSTKEYHDYSCMVYTDVLSGSDNPVLIKTNPTLQENVRMWIDYNNDAIFDPASELVFSSDKKLKDHLGLVQISPTALKNTMLRLRVSSEVYGIDFPSPCGTLKLGHAEDYGIIIYDNFDPPLTKFTTDDTLTCYGTVRFTDKTANIPASWLWDFGDGQTSTEKNPVHSYAQDGYYTINLKTSNGFGSDSLQIDSLIHVTINHVPKEANCNPQTIANCCGYGITNFTLNTINNTSPDGSEGYQDYSCKYQTEFLVGRNYTVSVGTGTNNYQDVRVWIDYNNDGDFEDTLERVYSADKSKIFSGDFTIPVQCVTDTLLRLRVTCDYEKSNPDPCYSPQLGQVEDYGVIIKNNTKPPITEFIVNSDTTCDGRIQFTDISLNGPTRWLWLFGDGNSDTIPNPLHIYADTGIYSVTLIAVNTFGTDTLIKPDFIVYRCNVAIPFDSSILLAQCSGTLTDNGGSSNYQNNSSDVAYLQPPSAVKIMLTFSTFDTESNYDFLYVYDGPDTNSPLIGKYSGSALPNGGVINSTGGLLTLHFTSDNFSAGSGFMLKWECTYPIPKPDFSVNTTAPCDGKVRFTDQTQSNPDTWLWDFGDGISSSQQNPEHAYTTDGVYAVSLKCSNAYGFDIASKNNFITVNKDTSVKISCTANTLTTCCGFGIYSFKLDSIDNISENAIEGSRDFTCKKAPVLLAGKNYPFEIKLNPDSSYKENVKIWCDLDTDGIFSEPGELLFSKNDLNGTLNGTLLIPDLHTNVYGKKIRLRVADASSSVFLLPCKDINYGQAEDYAVILESPAVPPTADFSAGTLTPFCSDTVYFTNLSSSATRFIWDFGEGTTDTSMNPTHVFSIEGTYTIKLIAFNQAGSDTLKKINYLSVSCVVKLPKTGNKIFTSCTGKLLDDNGSGNYSSNTDGSVSISPPGAVNIKLSFVSFNFETTKDFLYVYDGPNTSSPQLGKYDGTSLPGGGILQSTGPSITIRQTTNASVTKTGFELDWFCTGPRPVVNFNSNDTLTCNGVVAFRDISTNTPTKWHWDFGDGTSSEEQNPVHLYMIEGTYSVILTATNNFGNNALTKNNFIEVRKFSNPVKPQCIPATLSPCCNMGVIKVSIGSIQNISATSDENYRDFTCSQIAELNTHTYYALTITANDSAPAQNLIVLIDYNNDGNFDFSKEIIFSSGNFLKAISTQIKIIPDTTMVFDKLIRMRILTDRKENPLFSCKNLQSGQAEDYGIILRQNNLPPVSDFMYSYLDTCSGILKFTGLTQNASQWVWDFGDGSTSSQKVVTHAFRYASQYVVKCITVNLFGTDTLVSLIPSHRVIAGFSFSPDFPAITPVKPTLVSFIDTSKGATQWTWDFNDGNNSILQNPSHSYSQPGVYTVTQTIMNGACTSETQRKVVVTMKSGIFEDFGEGNYLVVYPNPSTGALWLNYSNIKNEKVNIEIFDYSGKNVYRKDLEGEKNRTEPIQLSRYRAGVYILKIFEHGRVRYRKLVLL